MDSRGAEIVTSEKLKQLLDLLIEFKQENGREQIEPLKTTITMVVNAYANAREEEKDGLR